MLADGDGVGVREVQDTTNMNTRNFLKSLAVMAVAPQVLMARAPDAFRREAEVTPVRVIYLSRDGVAYLCENEAPFRLRPLRRYRVGKNGFERVP